MNPSLDVLADNLRIAQVSLPVPLAVENIAATFAWPEDTIAEPDFLTELVERTGVRLVLDVANLYASAAARGSEIVDPEFTRLTEAVRSAQALGRSAPPVTGA
ncbi:DUF692 family multinuclear iron-containing protein [Nocardioides sp. NPDC057772]|uniref:multinuclear nonheme iron-dependent oxidase n=1 Tax=Nocardioides sp. NPDC057772 TaxID=3346245 RepID=UPI00367117EC